MVSAVRDDVDRAAIRGVEGFLFFQVPLPPPCVSAMYSPTTLLHLLPSRAASLWLSAFPPRHGDNFAEERFRHTVRTAGGGGGSGGGGGGVEESDIGGGGEHSGDRGSPNAVNSPLGQMVMVRYRSCFAFFPRPRPAPRPPRLWRDASRDSRESGVIF